MSECRLWPGPQWEQRRPSSTDRDEDLRLWWLRQDRAGRRRCPTNQRKRQCWRLLRECGGRGQTGRSADGMKGQWPLGQWKQKEENGVKGEADAAPPLNGRPPSEQGDPKLGEEETGAPLRASGNWKEGCVTRGHRAPTPYTDAEMTTSPQGPDHSRANVQVNGEFREATRLPVLCREHMGPTGPRAEPRKRTSLCV